MKYPQIKKKEIQTKNSNIETKTLIYFLQNYKKKLLQLFLANYLQNEILENAKKNRNSISFVLKCLNTQFTLFDLAEKNSSKNKSRFSKIKRKK